MLNIGHTVYFPVLFFWPNLEKLYRNFCSFLYFRQQYLLWWRLNKNSMDLAEMAARADSNEAAEAGNSVDRLMDVWIVCKLGQ